MLECLVDSATGEALVSAARLPSWSADNDLSVGYSYAMRHLDALTAAIKVLQAQRQSGLRDRLGSQLILVRNAVNSLLALCRRARTRAGYGTSGARRRSRTHS